MVSAATDAPVKASISTPVLEVMGGGALNDYLVVTVDVDLYFAVLQGEGMTKGNEVPCFLGCHGAGDDGGVEDGTFFGIDVVAGELLHNVVAEDNNALGGGGAFGYQLVADIDHSGIVGGINVRECGGGAHVVCGMSG